MDGISLDRGENKPDQKQTYGNIKKGVKEKEEAIMDAFRHFGLV